ncbi:anti-anti-sigma factor [Rubrivivax gelatinosus]|nr:anti-anti-sigma factor [Rubrivivax gelatinosus]
MRVPILRLNASVLLVALGADITDEGVMEFQSDLTERAARMQARGVVIDVSALDLVDSFMARVLNDSARMLRLLGAEVVVCGIQPAVAMTLVEMGSRLVDVKTSFTLERALAQLDELMARALAPHPAAPAAGDDTPPHHD